MFRMIWQYIRNDYARRRHGLDNGDIRHIRADLRFRLALVEYAYFGKSGNRVSRSFAELKTLLGEKAIHRYLRSLDPDLRTQYVERFQNKRRDAQLARSQVEAAKPATSGRHPGTPARSRGGPAGGGDPASNVVPIRPSGRKEAAPAADRSGDPAVRLTPDPGGSHSADSRD